MLLIYNAGIRFYFIVVYIASLFNPKARLWINGRKTQSVKALNSCTWFHFASLGEFEQGRAVLKALKKREPATKIVITFFSPSGYEIRKNTDLADAVYYLPLDTAKNAADFVNTIKPTKVIFTKYEYWYHFFNQLNQRHVPLYIISGIFRPGQIFFKWYGSLHRQMLKMVTHFFVQDNRSAELLKSIKITNATVSGDTRLDRVWANACNPRVFPDIAAFKGGTNIFIAGSTWPADEKLLLSLINKYPDWKFIIAPHEISAERIDDLLKLMPRSIAYSRVTNNIQQLTGNSVLIIDNIGMLSSIYRYGDIAYIGGGFGKGIHNTLEAAAFGLPVIFGPKYNAFKEANDLIELQAAFTINSTTELLTIAEPLMNNAGHRQLTGQKAKDYVAHNTGATARILGAIS